MRSTKTIVTGAALLALALTACAVPEEGEVGEQPASSTSGKPAASKPAESTAPDSKQAKIGTGTVTFAQSGLVVSVPKATKFRKSQYVTVKGTPVKVTVKVVNKSKEVFDLALCTVNVRYGADGEQAQAVFDSAAGIELGLHGSLAPGRTATGVYGFDVPKAGLKQIDVEVSPGIGVDSALFAGAVK